MTKEITITQAGPRHRPGCDGLGPMLIGGPNLVFGE